MKYKRIVLPTTWKDENGVTRIRLKQTEIDLYNTVPNINPTIRNANKYVLISAFMHYLRQIMPEVEFMHDGTKLDFLYPCFLNDYIEVIIESVESITIERLESTLLAEHNALVDEVINKIRYAQHYVLHMYYAAKINQPFYDVHAPQPIVDNLAKLLNLVQKEMNDDYA